MHWVVLTLSIVLGWIVFGLYALDKHFALPEPFCNTLVKWIRENPPRVIIWLAVILATIISTTSPADSFFRQMLPDFISLAVTVIFVDTLVQISNFQQEKRRVIEQMGSDVNSAALEAVRLAKNHKWLRDGSLTAGSFSGANLAKAKLQDSQFVRANLSNALLNDADLSRANFQGAILLDADLRNAILEHANFQGSQIAGANLQNAKLFDAKLEGLDLSNTDFQGAQLWSANLRYVHLGESPGARTINFQGADLNGANLHGAELIGVNLQDACLFTADLSGAYLSRANAQGANLIGANLTCTSLFEADLQKAKMYGADLKGCDLRGANLSEAEFYTTNNGYRMGGVALDNAIYDRNTIWPEGFDPKTAGARQVKWDRKSKSFIADED